MHIFLIGPSVTVGKYIVVLYVTWRMHSSYQHSFGFRWINSDVSLLHLEGLFLRLRLGKWEAGLGGTGYYVACITGMPYVKLHFGKSVSGCYFWKPFIAYKH